MRADHPMAHRALAVRGLIGDLWGNAMPPTPDPWLTMTLDGIACDDHVGREAGFVVFGDGFALDQLRELIATSRDPRVALELLPPALRERLAS